MANLTWWCVLGVVLAGWGVSGQAADDTTSQESGQWGYEIKEDEMTGEKVYGAFVGSANTVTFGFPYGGPHRATLLLRTHPRMGPSVMLFIPQAHFLCRTGGCAMLVRFDEDKPETFEAAEATDHSTNLLFINGHRAFINRFKKGAKLMRIQAEFYQEGTETFRFHVSGFDEARYLGKAK
jgi:hypothetical protein